MHIYPQLIFIAVLLASALNQASPFSFPQTSLTSSSKSRRAFLAIPTLVPLAPSCAHALVKGVAPPPSSKPKERPKCKTIDECQALQDAVIEKERELTADAPPLPTQNGLRYIDLSEGNADAQAARTGDTVTVKYKVLKAGKRSYDGLSGEATLIFSSGYELEDGEKPNSFFTYDLVGGGPGEVRRKERSDEALRIDSVA